MNDDDLRRIADGIDELRRLMRVLVGLLAILLVIFVIALIVAANNAARVQQQIGIG